MTDVVEVSTGTEVIETSEGAIEVIEISGGVTDHGALTGLADDDHTQYHNDARGDARYATVAQGSLADSAMQPGDDAADLGSGAAADTYVLTANGTGGAAWEPATGGGDVAGSIHAATSNTTPVDADEIGIVDSSASWVLKKLTWANLKSAIQALFGFTSGRIPFSNGTTLTSSANLSWDDTNKILTVQGGSQVASLSSEYLSNNEFTLNLSGWTSTGWTWNSGAALHTPGNTNPLSQSVTVAHGELYKVSFVMSGGTTGNIHVDLNGTPIGSNFGSSRSFAFINSGSGTKTLGFRPDSTLDRKLDSVSFTRVQSINPPLLLKNSAGNTATALTQYGFGNGAFSNLVTPIESVAIGESAAKYNTNSSYDVFLGVSAAQNCFSSSNSCVIGSSAAYSWDSITASVVIGQGAAKNKTGGGTTVAIGYRALYNNSLSNGCIAIGSQAGYNETGSNKLYIENSSSSSPLIYGEFDNDMVRINGMLYARKTTEQLRLEYDATNYSSFTVNSSGALTQTAIAGQTFIGGTGVTSKVTVQGTSGNGTSTATAIEFKAGNNGNITAMYIRNDGNIYLPGPLENTKSGEGIILKSPDGTRYKLTVANGGTLSIAAA